MVEGKLLLMLGIMILLVGGVSAAIVKGTNGGFLYVGSSPSADPEGELGDRVLNEEAISLKVVAPVGATKVTEIGWWADTATTEANYEVGIYTHNVGDDNPEAVVSVSATNAKGTDAGWKKVTGLNIAITAGTTYWIAVQLDATSGDTDYNINFLAGEKFDIKQTETTLTDPWGATDFTTERIAAIYAVTDAPTPSGETQTQNLTKYFRLNEGTGNVLYNVNNTLGGTLTGATWNNDGILITLVSAVDYTLSGNIFTIINNNYSWNGINTNYEVLSKSDGEEATDNLVIEFLMLPALIGLLGTIIFLCVVIFLLKQNMFGVSQNG